MQSKNNDIMNGMHLIEEIENIWLRIRNETDLHHDCWYSYQTVTLSAKADVNECMLWSSRKQAAWNNHPFMDTSEYLTVLALIQIYFPLNAG